MSLELLRARPLRRGLPAFTLITSAFTLIELLVVIAIIAILAAILFPSSPRHGESPADRLPFQREADSHGSYHVYPGLRRDLPDRHVLPWCGYSVNDYRSPKWMDMLYPYIKNTAVFTCPSFAGDAAQHEKYVYQPATCTGARATQYGTYVLNGVYPALTTVRAPAGRSLAEIQAPADTIFVTEGGDWGLLATRWRDGLPIRSWIPPPARRRCVPPLAARASLSTSCTTPAA